MKTITCIVSSLLLIQVVFAQTPRGEELMGLYNIPTAEIGAISDPIVGSIFYDSTSEQVMVYTSSEGWIPVSGGEKSDLSFDTSSGVLSLTSPATTGNQVDLSNYVRIAPVLEIPSNYTLSAADSGKVLYVTSATDITMTIPSGLPAGFNVSVYQYGTGTVHFVGAGAQVVHRLERFYTAGQYAGVGLISYTSDVINLTGDLKK